MTSARHLAQQDEFNQSGNRIMEDLIGGEIVPAPGVPGWSKRQTKSWIGRILLSPKKAG